MSSSQVSDGKKRIVVLISGSGTNLQALMDACASHALPKARIVLVFSNRKAALGLERARTAFPPIHTDYLALVTYLKAHPGKTRVDYDIEVARRVLSAQPDVVVLAGWMHILSAEFLDVLHKGSSRGQDLPILNLHPALPGAFDGANAIDRAYAAFQAGEIKRTGVMVHRVVTEVDRGEPVVVREIEIKQEDSLQDLEARIHEVEHEIIVEATQQVLEQQR
ncbi:phosphoribosylglycinamide formyltransferase [Dacryopinax primogenitus]|uniref:Phosphoribosylglycinamide formyltransferase n=1 Tax=Dacryopinax primogenitus (strain DJM 731) TaxID=1858805 RepID=M5FPC2_DACPD|nr:phosphoribosylglycinamide formyltransferase [Dacryopinax primogenitus]EJT98430.1 phosphoribosylglycinamide formyltransferase [Dacryopinax primogenitus]